MSNDTRCPRCEGSGYVGDPWFNDVWPCPRCDGTGETHDDTRGKCVNCAGTGVFIFRGPYLYPGRTAPCSVCQDLDALYAARANRDDTRVALTDAGAEAVALRAEVERLRGVLRDQASGAGDVVNDLTADIDRLRDEVERMRPVYDAAMALWQHDMAVARYMDGDSPNEPEDRRPMLEVELLAACKEATDE